MTDRMQAFVDRLRTSEDDDIIVVGHSLFFRTVFDNFASSEAKAMGRDARAFIKEEIRKCGGRARDAELLGRALPDHWRRARVSRGGGRVTSPPALGRCGRDTRSSPEAADGRPQSRVRSAARAFCRAASIAVVSEVCTAKHASSWRLSLSPRVLERRHGLVEIVERGAGVLVERLRVNPPHS